MAGHIADLDRAHSMSVESWVETYARLSAGDESGLAAADLDLLAEAAFWLSRTDDSIRARERAYAGFAAAGANRRAALAAWTLFYDYSLRGDATRAGGWLGRMRRRLEREPECVEHGYLAFAEADLAQRRDRLDEAQRHAERVSEIGRRFGDADLEAFGLQRRGHILIARRAVAEGLVLLDEAMCAIGADELTPVATGWLYCLAIGACFEVPDLGRAATWTDAAMRWCASLPAGAPFHGLCRVHWIEVRCLRGPLEEAAAEARRACDELLAYEPFLAGAAFYVAGEIHRRIGDHRAAVDAFTRAHELGHEPQPGLALVRLAEGSRQAAGTALRLSLAEPGSALGRARLLAAQVEVALASVDDTAARSACAQLEALARESGSDLIQASAATACGALRLAENEIGPAVTQLRRACSLWQHLGLPYETAQTRLLIAAASGRAGDHERARLELVAARSAFESLGAAAAADRAAALLAEDGKPPCGLTRREVDVLRSVAAGKSNRGVAAELVISEHTVARHLSNIFRKTGSSSRSAATAFAYERGLA